MKQEVLRHFGMTYLTIGALFIFMTLFVSVVFWLYRKNSKVFYQSVAHLPFTSEDAYDSKK
jgi:cbb3-type cytochrome oxidase subunit 3